VAHLKKGKKAFFFEKKKQKTFTYWTRHSGRPRASTGESFLLLFFKKEGLSCYPAV
jgi:hypothetical protein